MTALLDAPAAQLLDLLREADEEAVTLDELRVAGLDDPSAALRELELAGHVVVRVRDRAATGAELTCVRLGARDERPTANAAPPAESAERVRRSLLVAALALVLLAALAVVAGERARRA